MGDVCLRHVAVRAHQPALHAGVSLQFCTNMLKCCCALEQLGAGKKGMPKPVTQAWHSKHTKTTIGYTCTLTTGNQNRNVATSTTWHGQLEAVMYVTYFAIELFVSLAVAQIPFHIGRVVA